MSRTYVKGRISKDKRRGFRRNGWSSNCRCSYCCCNPRYKGWKKTKEKNEIKSIINEYRSINSSHTKNRMKLLIPMRI